MFRGLPCALFIKPLCHGYNDRAVKPVDLYILHFILLADFTQCAHIQSVSAHLIKLVFKRKELLQIIFVKKRQQQTTINSEISFLLTVVVNDYSHKYYESLNNWYLRAIKHT